MFTRDRLYTSILGWSHYYSAKSANTKTMAGEYRGVSGRYHIGRIVQIHPGEDGVGRNFVVDTGVEGKPFKTLSYMCIAPLFI